MLSLDDAKNLQGSTLASSDGTTLGKVSDVYIDNDTHRPEWALVHTGLFGGRESFVPLERAQITGGSVSVPYAKDQVDEAPNAEPDGELSQDEEARLYAHYGLHYSDGPSDSGLPTPPPGPTAAAAGQEIELSEERLRVGVVRRPSQTVRLSKRVVTENVTTTVPLKKERAHITREPVTDANRAQAAAHPEIGEASYDLELEEEQAVVSKETVPVELVHVGKESVIEQQTVTDTVHKEVADVEGASTSVAT
jgi:uncharacterized protein (TIGR02271 family)